MKVMLDNNKLTKKQIIQSIKYLSQFKKKYDNRSISESILVDGLYNVEFIGTSSLRYFGSMEAVLVIEKFIERGTPFDFKVKEYKFLGFKITVKETYEEFIIRKSKEFLKQKEVI